MCRNFISLIVKDPLVITFHFWSKIQIIWLSKKRNISIKGKLFLKGRPIIDICKGSNLYIGDGVILNSWNKDYHVNMHSPVKLFADRLGA